MPEPEAQDSMPDADRADWGRPRPREVDLDAIESRSAPTGRDRHRPRAGALVASLASSLAASGGGAARAPPGAQVRRAGDWPVRPPAWPRRTTGAASTSPCAYSHWRATTRSSTTTTGRSATSTTSVATTTDSHSTSETLWPARRPAGRWPTARPTGRRSCDAGRPVRPPRSSPTTAPRWAWTPARRAPAQRPGDDRRATPMAPPQDPAVSSWSCGPAGRSGRRFHCPAQRGAACSSTSCSPPAGTAGTWLARSPVPPGDGGAGRRRTGRVPRHPPRSLLPEVTVEVRYPRAGPPGRSRWRPVGDRRPRRRPGGLGPGPPGRRGPPA